MKRIITILIFIFSLATAKAQYVYNVIDSGTFVYMIDSNGKNAQTFPKNALGVFMAIPYRGVDTVITLFATNTGFTNAAFTTDWHRNDVYVIAPNMKACFNKLNLTIYGDTIGSSQYILWGDTITTIATQHYVQNYFTSHRYTCDSVDKCLGISSAYGTDSVLARNGSWVSKGGGGTNIYNSNGSLTGNRTVTMGNNNLDFSGTSMRLSMKPGQGFLIKSKYDLMALQIGSFFAIADTSFSAQYFGIGTDGSMYLPLQGGAAGTVLTNDGSGNASWQVPSGIPADSLLWHTTPQGYVQKDTTLPVSIGTAYPTAKLDVSGSFMSTQGHFTLVNSPSFAPLGGTAFNGMYYSDNFISTSYMGYSKFGGVVRLQSYIADTNGRYSKVSLEPRGCKMGWDNPFHNPTAEMDVQIEVTGVKINSVDTDATTKVLTLYAIDTINQNTVDIASISGKGVWTWNWYPSTRNDTATQAPINFLYTMSNGMVGSAPIGAITPASIGCVNADWSPCTDTTYTLGDATHRWKAIYTKTLYVDSSTINMNGTTIKAVKGSIQMDSVQINWKGDLSGTNTTAPTVSKFNGQLPSYYLSRANQTGTSAASTITGLQDTVQSYTPKVYNHSGLVTNQIKIFSDTVTVTSALGQSIDISGVGFSNIASVQVQVEANVGSAATAPIASVKSWTTSAVVVNLLQNNTTSVSLGGLPLSVLGLQALQSLTGVKVHITVIGY